MEDFMEIKKSQILPCSCQGRKYVKGCRAAPCITAYSFKDIKSVRGRTWEEAIYQTQLQYFTQ
jgi:hypothetical protein